MKKAFIGCGIIKKELESLLNKRNNEYDAFWLDEELHNHPDRLKEELQRKIDELDGYDVIVISFGLCGNALLGITATHCDIVYPAVDDCIEGMMCNNCKLAELRKNSVFVSRGWLSTRGGFNYEYNRAVERYGQQRAEKIYKTLYNNYRNVVYMKIEETPEADKREAAESMAERLQLDLLYEAADTKIYEQLLAGDEDGNRIKRLKKGNTLSQNDFIK